MKKARFIEPGFFLCEKSENLWKNSAMKSRIPILIAVAALSSGAAHAQNAAVSFSIDAAQGRHPINPNIYGVSFASQTDMAALNCPLNRWGGNSTTRHNWQQNASNRAADYYFESISDEGTAPGAAVDSFISASRGAGGQPMITIPTIGWIAKLGPNWGKLASFSVQKYGQQQSTDYWMPDAGNGVRTNGTRITGNDPNDANTPNSPAFQRSWIDHLKGKWGTAANGGVRYYVMDNETSLWHENHRDVHPAGQTMEESRDGILAYSAAVKASDPGALVVGPEEWGWSGYLLSGADQKWSNENQTYWNQPDKTAHGGADYLPWLLGQLHQRDVASGKKSLDVFSVHFYPQGGEFSNDISQQMQLRRNRTTRSLWDPNYTDETWINDKVRLVPRLKDWVSAYYPGLQTGITEYAWGADTHINGATAQADILGIFGREGLDMANRWTSPANGSFAFKAMQMYRNYDGQKSTFGDTAVKVTSTANPDNIAVFASQRTGDGALTVMAVNKVLSGSTPLSLNLAGFTSNMAQAWQLTSAGSITKLANTAVANNVLQATLPAQSVTLFVLGNTTPNATPTVQITAPANNAVVKSLAAVSGTAADDVRVTRVALYIRRKSDGKFWNGSTWTTAISLTTTLSGSGKSITWVRNSALPSGANLPAGIYELTAWAFDAQGNKLSTFSTFRADGALPVVTLKSPVSRSVVNSFTSVTGTTSVGPNAPAIKTVILAVRRVSDLKYWSGTAWNTTVTWHNAVLGSGGATWSFTGLPKGTNLVDGDYYLVAYATDMVGNKSVASASQFTLRRTAGVAEDSPIRLSTVSASADGTIRLVFTGPLNGTATDLTNYTLAQDGVALELQSAQQTSGTSITLTAGELTAGSHVTVDYNLSDTQGRAVTGSATAMVR